MLKSIAKNSHFKCYPLCVIKKHCISGKMIRACYTDVESWRRLLDLLHWHLSFELSPQRRKAALALQEKTKSSVSLTLVAPDHLILNNFEKITACLNSKTFAKQ